MLSRIGGLTPPARLMREKPMKRTFLLAAALLFTTFAQAAEPTYVKKGTRVDTITATLQAAGLPTLAGDWRYIGPFDNTDGQGFDAVYPPEKAVDLAKTYTGKDGQTVAWKQFKDFKIGSIVDLKRFKQSDNCVIYLYHEINAPKALSLPVSLGSDDSIKVWLNGKNLVSDNAVRPAAPDQDQATLKLKPGKNQLLLKIGNIAGGWEVYVAPELPLSLPAKVRDQLVATFRRRRPSRRPASTPPRPFITAWSRCLFRRTSSSKWAAWRCVPTVNCWSACAAATSGSWIIQTPTISPT